MIDLLSQADVEITKIVSRRILINEDLYIKFCESMKMFCDTFQAEHDHIKDRSSVLQYIFIGYKKTD